MLFMGVLTPHDHGSAGGCATALFVVVLMIFYAVLFVGARVVLTPLTVRASMMQDFGPAFNFGFVKRFMALAWKEIILASLFLMVTSWVLCAAGAIILCIGAYFAAVPIHFCWIHLEKQLYQQYLSRGGEPIPVSPKLRDDIAPL
jgi:hypothetical protein